MNRLGEDVLKLCPGMKDREDEEEIQLSFCFVLADEIERDGIITYHTKRVLELSDLILPLFVSSEATTCLMLHVTNQDHGVTAEGSEDEVEGMGGGGEVRGEAGEDVEEEEEESERVTTERWIGKHQRTVICYDHSNQDSCSNYSEEVDLDDDEDMAAADYPNTDLPRTPIIMYHSSTCTRCMSHVRTHMYTRIMQSYVYIYEGYRFNGTF